MPALAFLASGAAALIGTLSRGGSTLLLFPVLLITAPGSYASLLTGSKLVTSFLHLFAARKGTHRHQAEGLLFLLITGGGMIGAAIGTYFLEFQTNVSFFESLLGVTIIVMGTYLLFGKEIGLVCQRPKTPSLLVLFATFIFSIAINVIDGLYGGVGLFLTVYLVLMLRLSFLCAYVLTALSQGIIHLAQASYLLSSEPIDVALTVAVLFGAMMGSSVVRFLPPFLMSKWTQRLASVAVLVVGAAIYLR